MSFWYLQFSQKTNKKIRLYYYGTSSRIVFVRFLKELKTPKRHFEINWPLVPRICRNRRWISAFKRAHFLSIMMKIEAFTVHAFNLLTYTSWMPCQHLSKGTHFLKLWGDIQGNYSTLLVFKIFLWSSLIFTNYLDTKGKWSYYVST